MNKCSNSCLPVCDFCKFYTDYSFLQDDSEFEGVGICEYDNMEVCASDSCNNFYCFNANENKLM